jgi:regulator of RNase E activity RraA
LNKNLSPIIGFVRTAKIFSNDKNKQMTLKQKKRYYQYMGNEKVPKICIVEDSNINPVGCFWGEVQTNIHKKLGFKGVITNGSIRDLDDTASNFQMLASSVLPSHSCLQLKSIGKTIKIFGEQFKHNDIVHADQHGAVKIPSRYLQILPKAIKQVIKNEKPILDLCKSHNFSLKKLEDILNKNN